MPIQSYSVLKGDPTSGRVVQGSSPHYQITVDAPGGPFTVAVNIQSVDGSEVLYIIDQAFVPPDPVALKNLATGIMQLPSAPGGLAIDYVRGTVQGAPMVTRGSMTLLPGGSTSNELHNALVDLLNQAITDEEGTIYAYGSAYEDKGVVDGIHDIHMNQGNPVNNHGGDNGIWQDGALFMNLPSLNDSWVAVFIAFQTENWNTNSLGNPQ